jgi:hypothetical protein
MYPTCGPCNRYRNILFIEKEGFAPLMKAARIQERFDIAVISTKGMSVIASRQLLDHLAPNINTVLVLHDLDIAGFSIFGTLTSNGRRYDYVNRVRFVDIGLRLADVHRLELQSERVSVPDWLSRRETLRRHGATEQEIKFLFDRRVELNAMTSRQLIEFLERKLVEHGVEKVIPSRDVLERHARRVVERELASRALAEVKVEIEEAAKGIVLPDDIENRLRKYLAEHPSISWDEALAIIVRDHQER